MNRQIVLDTETTGMAPAFERIVEIGCVELVDRKLTGNTFHVYINPQKVMDQEVINIHGLTDDFLSDKPLFADIATDFVDFIRGAELVIHNAPFDLGFMDAEFARLGRMNPGKTKDFCSVLDTLPLSREIHPGQRHSLDALCKRYGIDNSMREKHGALLDAELLADVYLMMTGGQTKLWINDDDEGEGYDSQNSPRIIDGAGLPLVTISAEELKAHEKLLMLIDKKSAGAVWRKL